jgi:hypothetical protein
MPTSCTARVSAPPDRPTGHIRKFAVMMHSGLSGTSSCRGVVRPGWGVEEAVGRYLAVGDGCLLVFS